MAVIRKVIWNNKCEGYLDNTYWKDYDIQTGKSATTYENGVATTAINNSSANYRTMTQKGSVQIVLGHKYYARADLSMSVADISVGIGFANNVVRTNKHLQANEWGTYSFISTGSRTGAGPMYLPNIYQDAWQEGISGKTRLPVYVDLTKMFGEGLEPSTPEEFEEICVLNGMDFTQPQHINNAGTEVTWIVPGTPGPDLNVSRRRIIFNSPHIETISGGIASFNTNMRAKLKECKVSFQPVREGTGNPSPTNVRPISGWTGLNVYKTGVNIWDEEWEHGVYNQTTGAKYNASIVNTKIRSTNRFPCYPSTVYRKCSNANTVQVLFYNKSGGYISNVNTMTTNPFTTPSNCYYMTFYTGTNVDTYQNDISINYPSTDTSYHAYVGTTIPLDWETEAGTVYGGYVDLAAGMLISEYASDTFTWGDSQGSELTNVWRKSFLLTKQVIRTTSYIGKYCDKAPFLNDYATDNVHFFTDSSTNKVYIYLPKETSSTEKVQIVYKLETPITYQLTPQQIKTLNGTNNIWSDTNGDISVKYWKH